MVIDVHRDPDVEFPRTSSVLVPPKDKSVGIASTFAFPQQDSTIKIEQAPASEIHRDLGFYLVWKKWRQCYPESMEKLESA